MPAYFISTLCLVLLSAVLQQFVPIFNGIYDSRILLLPLCFLCVSVTLNPAGMLFLAYICGFLWDAQHALIQERENPVYSELVTPVETIPFGYSIILYGVMGWIMLSVQPLFKAGKWHISTLFTGIAVFTYLLIEYLSLFFFRGGWSFSQATLLKISFTSLFTMGASPLIYWLLFKLAQIFNHQISYDGLNKRRRYSLD